jgi:predicted RNA-binding protein (virulence factor B family)
MADLGKWNRLPVLRETAPGLYLDGGTSGEILLPHRYMAAGTVPGDVINVFIYRDSEDRIIATTETPKALVGDFACLEVVSLHPRAGAFLDWGLSKDLLLPFAEQEGRLRVGDRIVVYVQLDTRTGRIAASMRLNRALRKTPPDYALGEEVNLLVYEKTPLGFNAIVENSHKGLLFHDQLSAPLSIGQKLRGFVRAIRPGGKIDLSLDASGYQRVAPLTGQILQQLERNGGRMSFDDASSPESIRQRFACSKKAFKQALGSLYKQRRIKFPPTGGTELIKS